MEDVGNDNPPAPPDAVALLQIGTTVAAIAVALATLGQDKGPTLGNLHIVPALFLVVGLVSMYGSLYAMAALWSRAGMRLSQDLFAGNAEAHPHLPQHTYQALVAVTWGLWFLTIVHIALLYSAAF